jgi:uncharacterized protein YecT (DUF1311 family)
LHSKRPENRKNPGEVFHVFKRLMMFCCASAIALSSVVLAQTNYPYKKPSDFKTLESFKTVAAFEASFGKYVQDCLDKTGGGSGGLECLISDGMWDRELNIYYERLMKVLGQKERGLLKESQRAWIREREKTVDFNSALLDRKYAEETGSMYELMRARDADEVIVPIVRQRALLLKNWLEGLGRKAPGM